MKHGAVFAGLALTALLAAGTSYAADKLWTFQSSFLSDGAAVTGTFDYNATTNLYSNINVTVASSADYPTETFTTAILSANAL